MSVTLSSVETASIPSLQLAAGENQQPLQGASANGSVYTRKTPSEQAASIQQALNATINAVNEQAGLKAKIETDLNEIKAAIFR